MGLFTFKKDKWKPVFNNCDFVFAKNELISQLSGGVFPEELSALLDSFIKSPCRKNAIKLIQYDPKFVAFFADNKKRMAMMKTSGLDTASPRKSVNLLRQEPEFEGYCMSVSEDREKHQKLKEILVSKGYPISMLEKGFSDFWQEMM